MSGSRTVTFSYNPHFQQESAPSTTASTSTTPGTNTSPAKDIAKGTETYTRTSPKQDSLWFAECVVSASTLRHWRKTYKLLEQRKRQLKKKADSRADTKSSPLSSQTVAEEMNTSTPETSANDHESESDQGRHLKRRRVL